MRNAISVFYNRYRRFLYQHHLLVHNYTLLMDLVKTFDTEGLLLLLEFGRWSHLQRLSLSHLMDFQEDDYIWPRFIDILRAGKHPLHKELIEAARLIAYRNDFKLSEEEYVLLQIPVRKSTTPTVFKRVRKVAGSLRDWTEEKLTA